MKPDDLTPERARQLLASLRLRPGDRVLVIGSDLTPAAKLAQYFVGPNGSVAQETDAADAGGSLSFEDGAFDVVVVSATALSGEVRAELMAEAERVSGTNGKVVDATSPAVTAIAPAPPAGDETAPIAPVAERNPASTGARRPRIPWQIAAIGGVAAAVIAAGFVWVVGGAGVDDNRTTTAADDSDDVVGLSAGDETSPADDPAEPGSDDGEQEVESDSTDRSETDSGSSAGGPANLPPVIDDPGLSSNSLTLAIAPTARDPDGDQVSFKAIEVDGNPVDLANLDSGPIEHRFELADVGYNHVATVAFVVTDSRGARVSDEFTHELVAITEVRFEGRDFAVKRPADCFEGKDEEYLFLEADITLSGALTYSDGLSASINEQLAAGVPVGFRASARFVGEEPPPVTIGLLRSFAGWTTFSEATHSQTENGSSRVAGLDPVCAATFTYSITYDVL